MSGRYAVPGAALAIASWLCLGTQAHAGLTLDQALKASQETGRPVLAVAGSKT